MTQAKVKFSGSRSPNETQVIFSTSALVVVLIISSIGSASGFHPISSSITEDPVDNVTNLAPKSPLEQVVSHKNPSHSRQFGDTLNDIQIQCNSDNIVINIIANQGFNGMIYPKGLSKNSTCMTEYHQLSPNITYYLPLRSCNTMSSEVDDGVEYFNTVMVQPHRRLVTNQGRGYHIRCKYQTKERTITNLDQRLRVNLTQTTPSVIGSASMPSCSMKIYSSNDLSREVAAENVKIGDELHLVIGLEDQGVYGMLVTNCLVRDGMNWGEQPLIDDFGCPVDEDIMPQFVYSANLTKASVTFQAHKFPYTSSVYYQCNIRLCFRDGGCPHVPPDCKDKFDNNYKHLETYNELHSRHRRWLDAGELDGIGDVLKNEPKSMNMEVVSGINVDEAEAEMTKESSDPMTTASSVKSQAQTTATNSRQSDREFCMSLRKFAIAISLASLLLMAAIIAMIACLINRRKRQQMESHRNTASIYQDQSHNMPYSNRGYCRD